MMEKLAELEDYFLRIAKLAKDEGTPDLVNAHIVDLCQMILEKEIKIGELEAELSTYKAAVVKH